MHPRPTRLLFLACLLFTTTAFADSDKGRSAGETVYKTFGCAQCHGADLAGTDKGPDLRGVGKRLHRFDLYQQVHNGGGGMPAFGDVLDEQQLIHVVEYLRAQKKGPKQKKEFRSLLDQQPAVPQKSADPDQ